MRKRVPLALAKERPRPGFINLSVYLIHNSNKLHARGIGEYDTDVEGLVVHDLKDKIDSRSSSQNTGSGNARSLV